MMRKFTKSIFSIFIILFMLLMAFQSCKKDLNKIVTPTLNPTMSVPLLNTNLTLGHLLEQDSNLIYNSDSSIKIVYSDDSLFSIGVDEIIEIPEQEEVVEHFDLGKVEIDNVSINEQVVLYDMIQNIPSHQRDSILAHDGTVDFFPATDPPSQPVLVNLPEFNNFSSVVLSEGYLVLSITNNIRVPFQNINIVIEDIINSIDIGTILIPQIDSMATVKDSISLAGVEMSNSLRARISDFTSPGSGLMANPNPPPDSIPDPSKFVLVEVNIDNFYVEATTSNIKATSGFAKIPYQSKPIYNNDTTIGFDVPSGSELQHITLSKVNLIYEINSTIKTTIDLKLMLPDATIDGNPVTPRNITIPPLGTVNDTWNLDGVEFDLTTDPLKPYNAVHIAYEVTSQPTGENLVEFDQNEYVEMIYSLDNIDFSFVDGYFGNQLFEVDLDSLDLNIDFLDQISGGLIFSDPEISLNYSNSIGVPIAVNLNMTGKSKTGKEQNIDILIDGEDTIRFEYPKIPGEIILSSFIINKENSKIQDFLALPPKGITYSGAGLTNTPIGTPVYNFANISDKFTLGVDMKLPLSLETSDLEIYETVDVNLGDDFSKNVESASLKINAINGFPFSADFLLVLKDSISPENIVALDTISVEGGLIAAKTNAVGKVIETTNCSLTIDLNDHQLDSFSKANQLTFTSKMSTYESGIAKLYTNYYIKAYIAIDGKFKID
ncbi:MAG: hypothetical protein JEY97_04495 [Bacteroidales bacterium]|nr:hypothetical protein [Bacteroidales bacterium]